MRDPEGRIAGWGCSKCGRPETTDPQAPEAERRHLRNCDGETYKAAPFKACPWSRQGSEETVVGWWHRWRMTALWPFGGSADDQPAWVIEAFTALSAEDARLAAQERPKR